MARSTYYYRLSRLGRPDRHPEARQALSELHELHKGRYGYRRMTEALKARGIAINHKTVAMLMRQEGISCTVRRRRRRTAPPSPELAAKPNLLDRRFTADAPYKKAVTDVTEFDIAGTRLYVSALIDLYDGALMSLTMSTRNDTDLVMSMFAGMSRARRRKLRNMLIHSDQGILYRSARYAEFVKSMNITQSMSRKGNCYDNAVAESFFSTFKCETMKLYRIDTPEQMAQELKEYARYYNEIRTKVALGYKSPLEYRKMNGYEL